MTDTDWLALATIGAALLSIVGAILGTRRQRREIRDLHQKIGNGFAEEVTTQLGLIAGSMDALKIQVGIVTNRLSAHVAQHQAGVYADRKR